MGIINANKAGLMLGTLMGGWHFLWAILVATGLAQALLNFIFWMHFISPPYKVGAFSAEIALILIAVTTTLGYAIGYVAALIWNRIQR